MKRENLYARVDRALTAAGARAEDVDNASLLLTAWRDVYKPDWSDDKLFRFALREAEARYGLSK